jgi:hypothetical protein
MAKLSRLGMQRQEEADSAIESDEGVAEGSVDLFGRALHGGIGNAPMSGHGLARPDRADFTGGVIANGKDKIEFGRAGFGELVPGFAAQGEGGQTGEFQLAKRGGMDGAFGMAACAVGGEGGKTFFVEDGLGHDGACGISGAEEQDVVVFLHQLGDSLSRSTSSTGFSPA